MGAHETAACTVPKGVFLCVNFCFVVRRFTFYCRTLSFSAASLNG